MRRPPRNRRVGIFTRPVIVLMAIGGVWSMTVNLLFFDWMLSTGRSLGEAMAMIFVLLVIIEFFKAYNFRSDRVSALVRPFANRWLNLAILGEFAVLVLIVYVGFFQLLLGTFNMRLEDWLLVIALAATITPVLEILKWMARRGWLGELN